MGVRPERIEVRIEELVLDGLPPADAQGVGAAVERELSRLLTERGIPGHLLQGQAPQLIDAGAFARSLSATPPAVGGEIARAVYGGLAR
jgi:hypothetical protein